jgi:hypothetical protein
VDNAIIKLNVIWEHGMDIHTNVCHHAICWWIQMKSLLDKILTTT